MATKREPGGTIYAEVLGYVHTEDAFHMTAPRPDVAQSTRAIERAVEDAGIDPRCVDYVKAHASSTPLSDVTEVRAIRAALGARRGSAGGRHEVASRPSAGRKRRVRGGNPDPGCDLQHLPETGIDALLGIVLSNSFGFGGINACLVLAHPDWSN